MISIIPDSIDTLLSFYLISVPIGMTDYSLFKLLSLLLTSYKSFFTSFSPFLDSHLWSPILDFPALLKPQILLCFKTSTLALFGLSLLNLMLLPTTAFICNLLESRAWALFIHVSSVLCTVPDMLWTLH